MAGKNRSKNYPSMSLGEAIGKARKLYETDGRATVGKDTAVQAWGYTGLNGASLRALGALNQYGLLDYPAPRAVRLSEVALLILLEPEDSPQRAAAIREAARRPPVFGQIYQQYPDGLPGEASLTSWLVRAQGFTEAAAKDLIAALHDTETLAGQVGNRQIPEPERSVTPERQLPASGAAPIVQGRRMGTAARVYTHQAGQMVATLTLDGVADRLTVKTVDMIKNWLKVATDTLEDEAREAQENQSAPGASKPEAD